jgi:hypothetical protein
MPGRTIRTNLEIPEPPLPISTLASSLYKNIFFQNLYIKKLYHLREALPQPEAGDEDGWILFP